MEKWSGKNKRRKGKKDERKRQKSKFCSVGPVADQAAGEDGQFWRWEKHKVNFGKMKNAKSKF